jgi:hypothetical protein
MAHDVAPPKVSYASIRDDLRSGDLLLASGTAFFSRLIQHRTKSPYSHVGILWRNEEAERLMLYESVESKGVINAPFSRYLLNYNSTGRPYPGRLFIARHAGFMHLTPLERRCFLQFAIDVQQYEYDTKEIARIAVALAAPELAWEADLPEVTVGKRYICSVYAGEALQTVNLVIPHDPRGFLAPADFPRAPGVTVLWEIAMGGT